MANLNRDSLRALLKREGIRDAAYCLDGGHPNDKVVLDERPQGWAVYYSERGEETALKSFASESQACQYLFDLIIRDAAAYDGSFDTDWARHGSQTGSDSFTHPGPFDHPR